MEIKEMKLILTLAEEKNLTRAAELTGYTQSGVSHTLKKIEDETGFPLFLRTPKGLALTRGAELLLPLIRQTLSSSHALEEKITDIREQKDGRIVIGSYLSAAIHWLPAAIERFQENNPQISVQIREGGPDEIDRWIESGEVDFGILSRRKPALRIQNRPKQQVPDWIPLKPEPLLAVVPPEYDEPYFPIRKLADGSCFLIRQSVASDVDDYLEDQGIRPQIRYTSLNDYTVLSLVRHHLGVCIMPEMMIRSSGQPVRTVPVLPPVERMMGIRILSMKEAPPAVRRFIDCLREVVAELEDPCRNPAD